MSNYWAIAIGINQYKNFQPLLYAQWDAQALWTYWVREGGIPQTQAMLLTDNASPERTPSAQGSPILPTKKTIEQQLVQWGHDRVGPEDTLWCFFSGYGLNHQGKDYLMPLDGDPKNIAQTGIAADAFFSTLQSFPSNRIVVLLDLKRSPHTLGANDQSPTNRLGDDIAKQAEQAGIATIIASQPDQLSHETLTLRQGLFTATLLEGLRTHGCFQLGQLTQYLDTRLPELSEYHWRPRQEPMVVVSPTQQQQVLLDPVSRQPATVGVRSGTASTLVAPTPVTPNPPDSGKSLDYSPSTSSPGLTVTPPPLIPLDLSPSKEEASEAPEVPFTSLSPSGTTASSEQSTGPSTVELPVLGKELSYTAHSNTSSVKTILPPTLNTTRSTPTPPPSPSDISDNDPPETIPVEDNLEDTDNAFWSKSLKYWLPLLALMILVVLKLNWPAFTKQTALISPLEPDVGTSAPVPEQANGEGVGNGNGEGAIAPPEASSPVTGNAGDNTSGNAPENTPENTLGNLPENNAGNTSEDSTGTPPGATEGGLATDTDPNANTNESENPTDINATNPDGNNPDENSDERNSRFFPGLFGSNQSDGPAGDALEQAKAAKANGNYEDAAIWLSQVPIEAQTEEYERLRDEVDAIRSESGQANREVLDRAIATLNEARLETQVNQASDFGRAIAIANQIQPGQPLYDEAQSYILRWGEVILDLAKSRAQSGQYEKAIATVSLIEEDLPVLYPKAQQLLANWQGVMGVDDSSQAIIDAAKADITRFPDQAFPYNRGIGKLREIEPDAPLYGEAQQLIDAWSQEILNIATNRAQQGNMQLAIDTAKYVPQDTAAYRDALDAIEKWSQ